jgi:hypothetical protein
MAKTYLDERELEQFPTIQELTDRMGWWDSNVWGICLNQRTGDLAFTSCFQEGWELWHSMEDIYAEAHTVFGERYKPEKIRFMYFVGILTGSTSKKPALEYHYLEMEEDKGVEFGSNVVLLAGRN